MNLPMGRLHLLTELSEPRFGQAVRTLLENVTRRAGRRVSGQLLRPVSSASLESTL